MIPKAPQGALITSIKPDTWNQVADSLNQGRGTSATPPPKPPADHGIGRQGVWVKNTGDARAQYECSGLLQAAPVLGIAPDGNRVPVLSATDDDDEELATVVWQEPVAADAIGRAVISGLTLALLAPSSESAPRARRDGNMLAADDTGAVRLHGVPDEEDPQLCVVDLSASGGGGGPSGNRIQLFEVLEHRPPYTEPVELSDDWMWAVPVRHRQEVGGSAILEATPIKLHNWAGALDVVASGQRVYCYQASEAVTGTTLADFWIPLPGNCVRIRRAAPLWVNNAPLDWLIWELDGTTSRAVYFPYAESPSSYSAFRVPPGMSHTNDTANDRVAVTGIPTEAGEYLVTVRATAPNLDLGPAVPVQRVQPVRIIEV